MHIMHSKLYNKRNTKVWRLVLFVLYCIQRSFVSEFQLFRVFVSKFQLVSALSLSNSDLLSVNPVRDTGMKTHAKSVNPIRNMGKILVYSDQNCIVKSSQCLTLAAWDTWLIKNAILAYMVPTIQHIISKFLNFWLLFLHIQCFPQYQLIIQILVHHQTKVTCCIAPEIFIYVTQIYIYIAQYQQNSIHFPLVPSHFIFSSI